MGRLLAALAALLMMGCAGAGELKIATWNLQHLAAADGEGCRARSAADYRRARRYGQWLDADVVVLQEVENRAAVYRLFDPTQYRVELTSAPRGTARACRDAPTRRLRPQRTGFAIRRHIAYRRHPDLEALRLGGRAGADVTINHGGQPLRLLAVHLKSGCYEPNAALSRDPDCPLLQSQLALVENWLEDRWRAGEAAMVVGDFNRRFAADDPLWKALDDGTPEALSAPTLGVAQRCRGRYKGRPYVDHFVVNTQAARWLRGGFEPLVYAERGDEAPSDHCPITVRVAPSAPQPNSSARNEKR